MAPRLVTVAAVLAVPIRVIPAPLVPRMMAPALLIRRLIKPTWMPSLSPVMAPLSAMSLLTSLSRLVIEEKALPPIPLPPFAALI